MKLFPENYNLMQKLFGKQYLGLIILILLIVGVATCNAQTTVSFQLTSRNNVGVTSPKQDTLYLLDESIGHQIQKSWYIKDATGNDLYPVKPYFVFLPKDKFIKKLERQIAIEARQPKSPKPNNR